VLVNKHAGTPTALTRNTKREGEILMGIPRNRRDLVEMFSRRRVQGVAMALVLSAGLGIAATNGAFASPSAQSLAAATTPVAAASGTPGPATPGLRGPGGAFGPGPHFGGGPGGPGMMGGPFLDPVATYLGISSTDLRTALDNGQTLAQAAQAHGKSASDLKAFLLNQESSRIDQLINTNFKQLRAQFPGRPGGPFGADVATFLGISQSDLQTALQKGQTLAQVAQAHGKSASDLKTFLTNQLKTRLDQEVASGRITSQQETDRLNQESGRLDQIINSTGPKWGPPPAPPVSAPTATPTTG
jgi:hypothetical protein